jgi:hypothetical protein
LNLHAKDAENENNRFWVKKMFKLQTIDGQNPEVNHDIF